MLSEQALQLFLQARLKQTYGAIKKNYVEMPNYTTSVDRIGGMGGKNIH